MALLWFSCLSRLAGFTETTCSDESSSRKAARRLRSFILFISFCGVAGPSWPMCDVSSSIFLTGISPGEVGLVRRVVGEGPPENYLRHPLGRRSTFLFPLLALRCVPLFTQMRRAEKELLARMTCCRPVRRHIRPPID